MATILSAPRFARQNNEAAFADYDYYLSSAGSSRPVTPGILREHARQRDEEEAEQGLFEDDEDDEAGDRDALLSKRVILHTFPSRICSVEFGHSVHSSGTIHRGPWLCIRSISSTLFASVELSTKREKLLGHSDIRLVSLLEITHGDSILPSGIQSRRYLANGKRNEKDSIINSKSPIVDVHFHPERATEAVTVDALGNVGLFTCDLFKLAYGTWAKSVDWCIKSASEEEEEQEGEDHWRIGWAETDALVTLANRRSIWVTSLDDNIKTKIHSCSEDSYIISLTRTEAPDALLWVLTTRSIILFDLNAESQYKPLLSWEHNRNHADHLQLVATTGMLHANALLLTNPFDRMINLYIATVSHSGLEATTRGETKQVQSSLSGKVGYACEPCFFQVRDLSVSWHRWIRRVSWDKRAGHENEKIMIEMGTDGCMILKIVTWSHSNANVNPQSTKKAMVSKNEVSVGKRREGTTDLDAERTLHSLGSLYRVLMSLQAEASLAEYNEALGILREAARWSQEQESPNDTLLLPHDILAICSGEEGHSLESALMRLPLLPSFHLDDIELRRFLTQVWSAIQSDAYVLNLDTILQGQFASKLSLDELDAAGADSCDALVERYTPVSTLIQSAAQQLAIDGLRMKLRESSREIRWDMLLSSQVVSMRPITIEREESDAEQIPGEAIEASRSIRHTRSHIDFSSKPPSFSFAFFTPRLSLSSSTSLQQKNRRKVLTPAARYLLSEWRVEDDPKDYHYQHPYRDVEEIMSGSEDLFSQSDTDQRASQRRTSSLRSTSASQFDQGSFPSQAFSQPLPPTIGSASQSIINPASTLRNGLAEVNSTAFHSQPVNLDFPASQRAKPKKRRVGGF